MTRASSWLVCAALLSVGCGDGDDPPPAPLLPAPTALPECPDIDYSSCDIRERPCQAKLAELAACMRQSEPVDVPIDLLSEDEFRALLTADRADVVEPPIDHFSRALSVLGFTPRVGGTVSDEIDRLVDGIGGVYRPSEKRVVVVDHGFPADDARTDTVLVHELIHALQDADYDLTRWLDEVPRTFDAILAARNVFEGEASFYQYRAAMPLFGLDLAEVSFGSALEQHLQDELEQVLNADDRRYQSYVTVPYGMGALISFAAWQDSGPRGIDPLWASPPRTMQRVMAELFGRDTPIDVGLELERPEVGMKLYGEDVLGAWSLYLLSAGSIGSVGVDPTDVALAWRGDHFSVYTDESETTTFGLWQIELENEEAARTVSSLLARNPAIERGQARSRVYFAFGFTALTPSRLTAAGDAWLAEAR